MANKIETSSKNIKPRINLSHNVYSTWTSEMIVEKFSGYTLQFVCLSNIIVALDAS